MAGVELSRDEAVEAVAEAAWRLFPTIPEQRACQLASAVLRDLEAQGIRLVEDRVNA